MIKRFVVPRNTWRRPDADTNFPFENLKNENDINRYPFATFEIKLELAPNEREPEWIVDLEESGILEEAFDFSKFVHGIAVMFDTRVPLLPYWLAQMDNDIQQLPMLPSNTPSVSQRNLKGKSKAASEVDNIHSDARPRASPTTNERSSLLGSNNGGSQSYGTSRQLPPPQEVEQEESLPSKMVNSISSAFDSFMGKGPKNIQQERQQDLVPVILPPGVKIPKKVVTPLRVEPKVFFANERTYFSWMSFGTLISTFSLGFVQFR